MVKFVLIKTNNIYPSLDNLKMTNKPNNKLSVNENNIFKLKSNYVDMDHFKNMIKDSVEVIDLPTKDNEWVVKAIEMIQLDTQHYGDLVDCYEGKDCLFQLICNFPNIDDDPSKMPRNILSSFLSYSKKAIFGTAILFKTLLPENDKSAKVVDTTVDDLISVIMDNYYHTAVKVLENNTIEQVYFNNERLFVDPLNNFIPIDTNHFLKNESFGVVENRLLKFNLNFVYCSKDENKKINEPMTRLLQRIVKGNGVITSPLNENIYYDLSRENIINLLRVEKHLRIEENDIKEETDKNGLQIIKNKYRILNNRLKRI